MSNNNIIISDELLSAFLDGNTSAEETLQILNAAEKDDELKDIIRIANEVESDVTVMKPSIGNIPMTAIAAQQKTNYLCDSKCEEIILHQFGMKINNKSLLKETYRKY